LKASPGAAISGWDMLFNVGMVQAWVGHFVTPMTLP
jgi:hypothetical protein